MKTPITQIKKCESCGFLTLQARMPYDGSSDGLYYGWHCTTCGKVWIYEEAPNTYEVQKSPAFK